MASTTETTASEKKCRNLKCLHFNHLYSHNCVRWHVYHCSTSCEEFLEHKPKDPDAPVKPGVNGKFLVELKNKSYLLVDTLGEAEFYAGKGKNTRIFQIKSALEFQKMGWVSGESYQGGVI